MSVLSNRRKRAGAAAVALLALADGALAQEASTVTLRATGPDLTEEMERYVAKWAEAFPVRGDAFAAPETLTPQMVITRLCGRVTETYYQAFLDANAKKPLRTDVIGLEAEDFVWPACFRVDVLDGPKVTVLAGDNADKIYARLTGAPGTREQVAAFFSGSGLSWEELSGLHPGQVLTVRHVTEGVTFQPKPPLTPQTFLSGLKTVAGRAAGAARKPQPQPGKILVGDLPPAPNAPSGEVVKCRAPGGAPFDAAAVHAAYRFALQRKLSGNPTIARVAVVDNGFYGAKLDPPEFEGGAFAQDWFQADPRAVISRPLRIGQDIWPINFAYDDLDAKPENERGHGTHVTGLILGGPSFRSYWPLMRDDAKPWAQLTELNVGRGSRNLIVGAEGALAGVLGTDDAWIVNLSVGFDGAADPYLADTFDKLFQGAASSLFVVSAGNDRNSVAVISAYPAAFGGPTSANVISVAALDGDGGLAPFSNFGRQAVDIAAPGCGVESWLGFGLGTTPLNGTSQAAPLVTFGAALLRSLNALADARDLKIRLLVSGDLLLSKPPVQPKDRWRDEAPEMIAFRVALNVPRALHWSDDYVRLIGADAGEYLGEIWDVSALTCATGEDVTGEDLWAFKRDGVGGWLYQGRNQRRLHTPCPLADGQAPKFSFLASHQIVGGVPTPLPSLRDLQPEFADVVHIVRSAKIAN